MAMHKWAEISIVAGIWSTVLAVLALSVGSPLYLGSKIDSIRTEVSSFRSDMYQEMKDFHGRLERHDCQIEMMRK